MTPQQQKAREGPDIIITPQCRLVPPTKQRRPRETVVWRNQLDVDVKIDLPPIFVRNPRSIKVAKRDVSRELTVKPDVPPGRYVYKVIGPLPCPRVTPRTGTIRVE